MTTKQYLRFTPGSVFGIIGSSSARILHLYEERKFNSVVVPACENVVLWNLQTKEKSMVLKGESSYVSCLMYDAANNIAVGYGDGVIRIFSRRSGSCIVSFCGHKSAVSCLTYDEGGLNLASGGKDSEIVVWNVTDQAGLFRLKGHKGPVTQCYFFKERNALISSSKDTYLKLWDLDTQHCVQTIVGSRCEILDFIVLKDSRLIVAINDSDLAVWDLFIDTDDFNSTENAKRPRLDTTVVEIDSDSKNGIEKDTLENEDDEKFKYHEAGKILTPGDKTVCLIMDKTQRIFGCSGSTKILQLYKILNLEEAAKHLRKRKKKETKASKVEVNDTSMELETAPSLSDEFQAFSQPIQTNAKIDSFSIVLERDIAKIAVLLKNNTIFHYQLDIRSRSNTAEICHSLILPGHRSIVKSLNYSADNSSILSASNESVKIWKRFQEELVCTQTIACDSALCSLLVSGSNYCIIGTKNGILEIYDVNSQQLLEKVESHENAVNCICESPNQCGVTTGSKDKFIKFWDFELSQDESYSQTKKRLTLSLKRTLQMPDEIICLRYSPDKKKIAIALLDNTVQVLFIDSLKLVFSLYGHVLPVTCMDISYDGTLIVTASEDKDIRIWSMEFGSCNRFIKRAHDKGITCLYFLPKTHMFFTGGKDHAVKQWDADSFQRIITLKGHQNEVTAMAVSPNGVNVVTASRDKSMRIWEKTSEPLVLEEEQEKEREEEEEGQEVEDLPVVPGEVNKEVALPGIKTKDTIKTADQLIDALNVYKDEVLKLQEYEIECKRAGKELPLPTPHPLLIAYSASSPIRYVQKVLNRIKSSELEGILLYLPFNYVLDFLKILCEFADRGWETELCERCSSFLVRIHLGQMLSAQHFQPVIENLMEKMFSQVYRTKDMIGVVKIACQLQQQAIDAQEEVPMFTSVLEGMQQKKKKSRKKLSRSVVAFS